jgi:membrane-bound inhibitor of C-type lysozyme
MLNVLIDRIKIEKNSSLYSCNDLPITVTLLHDHKNSPEQYQQKGNVIAALETYNTIICLK